jgi:hypothetical protein
MGMSISDSERQSLRTQVVDEHVRLENRHDLNGIMTTFGAAARYDDEPWDAHYIGRDSEDSQRLVSRCRKSASHVFEPKCPIWNRRAMILAPSEAIS